MLRYYYCVWSYGDADMSATDVESKLYTGERAYGTVEAHAVRTASECAHCSMLSAQAIDVWLSGERKRERE